METLSNLVKVNLPNYFSNLPIPNTFGGWFRLGCKYFYNFFFQIPNKSKFFYILKIIRSSPNS